jgi:hypothetical protein
LDNSEEGFRETFTVAQRAYRRLEMEIQRYLNREDFESIN